MMKVGGTNMKKVVVGITSILLGLMLVMFNKSNVNTFDLYKIECNDEIEEMVTNELAKEWEVEIHKIYYVEKRDNITSVYMRILAENGDSGYGDLMVLSFNENNDCIETWTPEDGAYYTKSVKDKFPISTHNEIFEPWYYGEKEHQSFLEKKQEY